MIKTNKLIPLAFFVASTFIFVACGNQSQVEQEEPDSSNIVENKAQLDAKSSKMVADLEAGLGGRAAYDSIPILQWQFFGSRMWWWNKHTGDVRCESLRSDIDIIMNVNTKEGQVKLNGEIQSHPDSLSKFLNRGYSWWINDSYWLVMPFKLNDPGIKLKHIGQAQTMDSTLAEQYELTFENVGITPSNKYGLYIDPSTNRLIQWDFYRTQMDSLPRFQMPWLDYESHLNVLFSADRGGRRLDKIAAYNELPDAIFTDLSLDGFDIIQSK